MVDDTRKSDGTEQSAPVRNKTVHTALINGTNFRGKAVQYVAIDGLAMFEGDIVLGTLEQVQAETDSLRAELAGGMASAVLISGSSARWPNCTMPYDIDPSLPDQARVTDAIAHWQANTGFRFVLRTAANAASYPDWVTFRPSGGCSSSVGRRGGQQFINLAPGCTLGNTIHEIGHSVGLWHEQSREDRDSFVTITWSKIISGMEHNFNQHISDGDDVGAYDYGSIMHYPRDAFSRDGSDTITPLTPGVTIGQRTGLSAGDIAAVNSLCPPPTRIETPKRFLETAVETLKERGVETVKELSPETLKERIGETIKERFETLVEGVGGGTAVERLNPGVVVNPGWVRPALGGMVVNPGDVGLPFAMATPYAGEAVQGVGEVPLTLEDRVAVLEELVALLAAERDAAAGFAG